jgi:hypothetical protein
VLFLADIRQQPPDEAIRAFYESLHSADEDDPPPVPDPFMEQLVHGTIGAMGAIDKRIMGHSQRSAPGGA